MKFKFKNREKPIYINDSFWYELTDGGGLSLEDILEDSEQIKEINKAINLIHSFESACYSEEIIGES